jgi:hypothetical protein
VPRADVGPVFVGHPEVATVPLNRGAGQAHLALPASVTVAYDAAGKEVARHAFVDNENNIVDLYEPPVEFPRAVRGVPRRLPR